MGKLPDRKHKKMEKYILRKAFDVAADPYLPEEVLWRQKEQFSDGVGYDWVDGLRDYSQMVGASLVLLLLLSLEMFPCPRETAPKGCSDHPPILLPVPLLKLSDVCSLKAMASFVPDSYAWAAAEGDRGGVAEAISQVPHPHAYHQRVLPFAEHL